MSAKLRSFLRGFGLLLLLAVLASACGMLPPATSEAPEEPVLDEPAAEEPMEEMAEGAEEAEEAPAAEPGLPEFVVYGPDSRQELYEHPDQQLQALAASVAILALSDSLSADGESFTLNGAPLSKRIEDNFGAPLCSDQPFATQPSAGFCTGFLIAEDKLLTAGHCMENISCADTSIVFGYQMDEGGATGALGADDVYHCQAVIEQRLDADFDYAILQLDRPTGRQPLALGGQASLQVGTPLAIMGYPSGLPLKIAAEASVTKDNPEQNYFIADVDAFGGNSGSPVINMNSYLVEGLVVRGEKDFVPADVGGCLQINRCQDVISCQGETVLKMAALAERLTPDDEPSTDQPIAVPALCGSALFGLLFALAAWRFR